MPNFIRNIVKSLKSNVHLKILKYVKDKVLYITPWLVVRKRTIPTERPPLVSEIGANFCG
jgi:hypothetical protein